MTAGKSLDGLHPTLMRPRVEAILADPEAQAMGVTVVSAYRSVDYQAALFAAAVRKYGSVAAARKWVAPPGKSNHGPRVDGFGTAVDFGVRGVQAVSGQWPSEIATRFDAIAARHGLFSPMEWEDWHFEPLPNWTPPEDDVTPEDIEKVAQRVKTLLMADDALGPVRHHIAGAADKGARLPRVLRDLEAVKEAHGIED